MNTRLLPAAFVLVLGLSGAACGPQSHAPTTEVRRAALTVPSLGPAAMVAAGGLHTCARLTTGQVACWGEGSDGELGDGASTRSLVPVLVDGLTDAVTVSAGGGHSCAVRAGGQVVCWGSGESGELGNGDLVSSPVPVTVSGLTDAVTVSAGYLHTCALRADHHVVCWGSNYRGQLGDGSGLDSVVPVEVAGLSDAVALSSTTSFGCAVRTGGGVVCWGGPAGGPTSDDAPTPVAIDGLGGAVGVATGQNHVCALRGNGTVACWGNNNQSQLGDGTTTPSSSPVMVVGLADATSLSVAGYHACVRRATGEVACWGQGGDGRLGNAGEADSAVPVTVSGLADAAAVGASTNTHTCAVRNNGAIVCWGSGALGALGNGTTHETGTPVAVVGVTGATSVEAGGNHTCARLESGQVACWGLGEDGQLGNGSATDSMTSVTVVGLVDAASVATGKYHSCAARETGEVVCWGRGISGQLGDGTVGSSAAQPVAVQGLTDATAIAAGDFHTCALHGSGAISCWGANLYGSLGDGGATLSALPVAVTGVSDAVAIAGGGLHTCALRTTGRIVCWGANHRGQLGAGLSDGTSPAPVAVTGLSDAVAVAAGLERTCALRAGGGVACWGDGPLGNGVASTSSVPVAVTGLSDATAIATGFDHTCAARAGGAVSCWGRGDYGQLGDGRTRELTTNVFSLVPTAVLELSDAASISAGDLHSCVVRTNGEIACWGANWSGQLGTGAWKSSVPIQVLGIGPLLSPNGASCASGSTCATDYCADGVCCDAACGGSDPSDCQACSTGAGAAANGTCGPRTGQVCGAAPNLCQTGGVCGAGPTCPGPTPLSMCVQTPVPECSADCNDPEDAIVLSTGSYTVTIKFPAGMSAGDFRVVPCGADTATPPSEYQIAGGMTAPACWDLHTTATYPHANWPSGTPVPDLEVCITYPPEVVDGLEDPSVLQLAHFTSGGLSMITIESPPGQVCGTTSSLSPFAILVPRDRTRPVLGNVPGPIVAYATSAGGAVVTYATPTAVDAVDGPLAVKCAPAAGSRFPLGKSNVTCTAKDAVGNKATATIPIWVKVQAPAGGAFFLPPINPDGSSVFKGGTIPVKFKLTGTSAAIRDLVARLAVVKVSSAVAGCDLEATSNGSANEGNVFRYDAAARQYIYNLATKSLPSGTWSLRADLGDGVTHQINVSLKGSR